MSKKLNVRQFGKLHEMPYAARFIGNALDAILIHCLSLFFDGDRDKLEVENVEIVGMGTNILFLQGYVAMVDLRSGESEFHYKEHVEKDDPVFIHYAILGKNSKDDIFAEGKIERRYHRLAGLNGQLDELVEIVKN